MCMHGAMDTNGFTAGKACFIHLLLVFSDYILKANNFKSSNHGTNLFQLIVWAPTRERAIARMKRALDDTIIIGKLCYNLKQPYMTPGFVCIPHLVASFL